VLRAPTPDKALPLAPAALLPALLPALLLALLLALPAGCGFIGSGRNSPGKPDAFVLRGYVSVAGMPPGSAGSACQAPPAVSDISAGGPVRIADAEGHTLAAGTLAGGVLAVDSGAPRCNFPFEIAGVAGGVDRYVIGVGNQPPVSFPARDLRENKPAVISVPAVNR